MDISGKGVGEPSRYTLEIAHSRVRPDVLNFHGLEALSEPYEWRIEFTAPQSDLAPEDVLLKYATLKMLSGRVVYGVITRFEWLGTSADQTLYAVTLASRLALLSLTRRCAVYQNLSVPELLEQILRAQGLEGPDFDFRLERSYPQRELITQWRETESGAFYARIHHERELNSATRLHLFSNASHLTPGQVLETPESPVEDLRGQEHVALTTPYGASSLNQGHITNEQSQQRGAGFELRTDEYGVIRVAKGLFVTAEGQTKAAGEVLEREAAQREIEICLNQIQQLADAAAQAQALEADIASQTYA
ncbi:type VI secretion system Vgr family protein [Cronobacter sakazakii]|nr:type VI secretion system Vgr family protein [Cronobacter sakazakii]ELQ6154901.1 type VI secretion system Vgr family protein [Cronobacter sakazakii]ELQ6161151.1 type VI secretion system Vgr family protein [Cronobacter sakazakii]